MIAEVSFQIQMVVDWYIVDILCFVKQETKRKSTEHVLKPGTKSTVLVYIQTFMGLNNEIFIIIPRPQREESCLNYS